MKAILIFVSLILFIYEALSQSTVPAGYTRLSARTYENNTVIKDLRQLGAEYTLEQGIFKQKPALPNGYWSILKTESVYRRIANGVTYYRYTVQLLCESEPYLIRATYTVAFRTANGNTVITQYSYAILNKNPDTPVVADAPSFINNSLLVKGSDLQKFLDIGLKYTIADATSKGLIKKSASYSFVRLFSIQDTGFSIVSGYNYLIQIASKEGYNYRVRIIVWDNSDLEPEDEFDPEYTIYPNA